MIAGGDVIIIWIILKPREVWTVEQGKYEMHSIIL